MSKKFLGLAGIAVCSLVACHSIFNKDKAVNSTTTSSPGSRIATAINPVKVQQESTDSTLRYIYLTFDDGPDAGTLNCYDICKSKGAKATFFLVGTHAGNNRGRAILDTMRKDMRHILLANHSYSHADHNRYNTFYKQADKAFVDFMRVQDSLRFDYPIARFPGNNAWVVNGKIRTPGLTKPLTRLMDSAGYNVMGWDVEWNLNSKGRPVQSAELMAEQVMEAFESNTSLVKNHVVILTHDRMFREENYRDSLARLITIFQSKKGYVFETADQYPNMKKNEHTLLASER